jgi:hypothetical protein
LEKPYELSPFLLCEESRSELLRQGLFPRRYDVALAEIGAELLARPYTDNT